MAPIRNNDDILLQKIEDVSRKQDRIPDLISEMERRQRQDLDLLRRDFERLFVSHAEYDPKHQILLDRMKEYDNIVSAGRSRQDDYVSLKSMVAQHDEDIDHIQSRSSGLPGRMLPWVALFISLAAVLLNYAQHIAIR